VRDCYRRGDPTRLHHLLEAGAATGLQAEGGLGRQGALVPGGAWGNKNLPPFAQKNIAKTPLVGGQWRLRGGNKYDIVITDNKTAPNIPVGGKMEAIG
jgi:branched-chain amino acid transport system substrate-binding protein